MEKKEIFTIQEAELFFAKNLNGEVHQLLEKQNRSDEENEYMLYAAFGSAYHWKKAGTEINQQRAEWLIAHVYTVNKDQHNAMTHAKRCLELSFEFPEQMQDFDWGYAFECMARAYALQKNILESQAYYKKALDAGNKIADVEDRTIFMQDLTSGDWYNFQFSNSE